MSPNTTRSLSFRPWARDAIDDLELKDVLQRVNLERGHFRDITEASLQEEIAAEGGLELSDSEHEDEDEDEDETQGQSGTLKTSKHTPTTREDLYRAKMEMLQHVSAAEQDILMSLDFVSLLESKYEPGRATSTISPVLKNTVPTGSFGADIWHRMPGDPARDAQEELLATNVRLAGLQQSADDLLAAATRLHDNVRKETRYWDQILSISERGWNVLRLPRQSHLLGVHFGFSGSTSAVGKRDVAALLTDADGNIKLERGLGTKPKALRAVIRREDKVVGSSTIPAFSGEEETTLESRIRFARDSVFDEELYHEMIREGRSLAAIGVTTRDSAISLPVKAQASGPDVSISLQLVSTSERSDLGLTSTHELDSMAQSAVLALRLFLGHAHREKLRQKTRLPPPMKDQKDELATLLILRPFMSIMKHLSLLTHLNSYMDGMAKLLQQAQVDCACEHATMSLPTATDTTSLEQFIGVFVGSLSTTSTLTITPPKGDPCEVKVELNTSPTYGLGSEFSLTTSPQRSYRFNGTEDLVAGVDGLLASALARALHGVLGPAWKISEREAILQKPTEDYESNRSMRLVLDSMHKTMSLKSTSDEVIWKLQQTTDVSLWNAWRQVIT